MLVADDDAGTRDLLRALLEEQGFSVVGQAESGEEAVAITPELRPDVVLMDLRMPGMGGIEATRRIREVDPRVQVVLLTVHDEKSLEASAQQAGAYCYLVKGCPPSLICDVLLQAWQYKPDS